MIASNRSFSTSDASQSPVVAIADRRDDDRLIAAARSGNAEAYGRLVEKYRNRLCSALHRVCGSMADAQDAAQDAFLQAFLKLDSYAGASAFYSWLYRIAVNAVINQHRRTEARTTHEKTRSQQFPTFGGQSESPVEPLLRHERVTQLRSALGSLCQEHRVILVLREMEDRDYGEIADLLAIPVGTVRSRLHRARLALRERLVSAAELIECAND